VKRELHFDLETRSTCDLRAEGVYKYCENVTTQIILMSYAFDDGPIKRWFPIWGEPPPEDFVAGLLDPECVLAGHNSVGFEHKLTLITGRKYFSKEVLSAVRPYSRWTCTAVRAAAVGLPRDLDGASVALRITEKKDKLGAALMLSMCKPHGYDINMKPIWKEDRESILRLADYCDQDCRVERSIGKLVPELSEWEMRVWHATERLNDRGIRLDGPLVERMAEFVKEAEVGVNEKINRITNGRVPKVTNTKKLKEWLADNDIVVDNVAKNTLKDILNAHAKYEEELQAAGFDTSGLSDVMLDSALPDHVKEVLLLRQSGAKSASGKYKSALNRINRDNRARGSIRYCGAASTSRFSAVGLQTQNLFRGSGMPLDIEACIADIMAGASVADIEAIYAMPPLIVASDLVRPSFIAKPGHAVARGDYAQVEARVSCWLGSQADSLQAYRDFDAGTGPDIYKITAAKVLTVLRGHLVTPEEVTKSERQIYGKTADLACGFGGGKGAFLAFARIFGIHITEDEAQQIVDGYRAANPGKAAGWKVFERAAFECLKAPPGQQFWCATRPGDSELLDWQGNPVYGNTVVKPNAYFRRDGRRMILKMPSGGQIVYWYPMIEKKMMPWGKEKDCITYYAQDSQKKIWRQFSAYGGLLFQNFVQRYARDIAANALLLLDQQGNNPILMIHDEILIECDLSKCDNDMSKAADIVKQAMLTRPEWMDPVIPISVEASANSRYVKA
jgi:DNA polymerase